MPRLLNLSLRLVIFLTFTLVARADPIQSYVTTYSDSLGLDVVTPIELPNFSRGGSVVLGTLPIVVQPAGSTPQAVTPINGTFQLDIGLQPPPGWSSGAPLESITAGGRLQGTITATPGTTPSFSGGFSGSASYVGFPTGILYNVPDLQSLSQHPERIHILGQVIPGPDGTKVMQETLTIDPPEIVIPGTGGTNPPPIPEPAPIATFLVAIGGFALRRRWFPRSRRAA